MGIEMPWFREESPRTSIPIKEGSCDYDGSVSTLDSSQKPPISNRSAQFLFFLASQCVLSDTIKIALSWLLLSLFFLTHLCLSSPLLSSPLIDFLSLACIYSSLSSLLCDSSGREELKFTFLKYVNENEIFGYDCLFGFY